MGNELRFDWFPVTESKELEALAQELAKEVISTYRPEKGKRAEDRANKVMGICRQLISALYSSHVAPYSSSSISFPRRASSYHRTQPRKVRLSYKYSIKVFDCLQRSGWVEVTKDGHDRSYTRIACSGDLKESFDKLGLKWFPQELAPKEELVVLRDVKRDLDGKPIRGKSGTTKFDMPVPDSPEVDKHRDNLYEINTLLNKHCIHLELNDKHLESLCEELSSKAKTSSLDHPGVLILQNTQLYRIFSRGSMEKGGRFYRGWWQSIPSIHRPHIRLNGKLTIEVDYSAVGLRIIYAQLGIHYDDDKDPYDLGLHDWEGKSDPRRKVVKKAFNALINDEDGVYKLGTDEQKSLGMSDKEFRELVEEKHPEIAKELGSDIGLKAQFTDSQIAEAVMLDMLRDGIPILPIHDSFIVTAGNRHMLEDVMKHNFREIMGAEVGVEAEVVKLDEHFGLDVTEIEELAEDKTEWAINGSDIPLEELFTPITATVMGKFSSGWLTRQYEDKS